MTSSPIFVSHVKKIMITLLRVAIASLFILAMVVAVCEWLGWPFLRAPMEAFLQNTLQRQVRVAAPFKLHLLGNVRLQAGGLWIAAPTGFKVPQLMDAKEINLALSYQDILAFKNNLPLHISALTVKSIDVNLLRHADGKATWQFNSSSSAKAPALPEIDTLHVGQGKLLMRDPLTQTDFNASFDTQEGGANKQPVSHVRAKGTLRHYAIEGQLDTAGFLPIVGANAKTLLKSVGWVKYGGVRVDFDGVVSDLFGKLNIQGKVQVKGASLAVLGVLTKVTLPTTRAFVMQGTLDKSAGVWKADIANATIGKSQLSGSFRFNTGSPIPTLDGQLNGQRFVLADLAPAFGVLTPEGEALKPPAGRIMPDRLLDLPALKNMNAHVDINIHRVDLGNAFAQPIAPFKAMLTLDKGKLSLADINAQTAQGKVNGQLSVDTHPEIPLWKADLAWDGIQLQQWIKVANKRSASKSKSKKKNKGQNQPPYFTGTLYGKASLEGNGRSTAQIFSSLDGEVSAYIRQGSISHLIIEGLGLDVAQGIGLLLGKDESLAMDCAVVNMTATNGLLIPRVALIDTPVTLVLSDGNINLNNEHLALRVTAKPKNFSPFTLRTPIHVDGSFLKPIVTVEKWPIARTILASIVLGAINPLAAILPLFDFGAKTPVTASCKQTIAVLKKEAAAQKQ